VQYVLVTPYPLDDHGSRAEARLLEDLASHLRPVWNHGGFRISAAPHRARRVTGLAGALVMTFGHDRVRGVARRPGSDSLRVSFSSHRAVAGSACCAARGTSGMSPVRFARAGAFSLTMPRDPLTIGRRIADPDC
jgi:hypothetical protein